MTSYCAAQRVYLEFLERTNNSIAMRRCDDCGSDAIDLSANPVPFGDRYHYVAHVRTFIVLKNINCEMPNNYCIDCNQWTDIIWSTFSKFCCYSVSK